jgi:hypothetical protein
MYSNENSQDRQDGQNRIGRTGHADEERQNKTIRHDYQERTDYKDRLPGKHCQYRTAQTGLLGQDCQDRAARTGLPGQGCQDRAARTGMLG